MRYTSGYDTRSHERARLGSSGSGHLRYAGIWGSFRAVYRPDGAVIVQPRARRPRTTRGK